MSDYEIFVYGWIAIGFLAFPFILRYNAPYGRHTTDSWGPLVDNKVAWIIMELPALILCPFLVLTSENAVTGMTKVFILIWVMHYFNRSIVFPMRIKTKKKKMPLLIAVLAFLFNVVNGLVNGIYFGSVRFDYSEAWASSPEFIVGISLFFIGFYVNNKSDSLLISLRKGKQKGYVIPRKGLFNYVSCPNFFGEMLEWLGFAIMTWSVAGLAFFLWTFFNLVPRALSHHRWYKSTFPDYPKERKAVFPFIL